MGWLFLTILTVGHYQFGWDPHSALWGLAVLAIVLNDGEAALVKIVERKRGSDSES